MIELENALELIRETVRPLETENVALSEAIGRTLASDVCSDIDSPPYDKSMMDGFAVRSKDIAGGTREFKVLETIAAGGTPDHRVTSGTVSRIMTGAPVPEGADCVIVVEWTSSRKDDSGRELMVCEVPADVSVPAGRHVIRRAENIADGKIVLKSGESLRGLDAGLLAEVGAANVNVFRRPQVAVLPTGNEIVDCSQRPGRSQIRNSNGPMLVAMTREDGLTATDLGIAADDRDSLRELVEKGLEHDVLILSGGVSMGDFDLVPGVLKEAGVQEVFHKVKMKPGKPVWFGVRETGGRRSYVFGLPGNPVSSLVGFHLLVRGAFRLLSGRSDVLPRTMKAILDAPHEARGNRPTFWPGAWSVPTDSHHRVTPLAWRGSSDLSPLAQAQVLIRFPAGTKKYEPGELLGVIPL